jgi:hypothetical protein
VRQPTDREDDPLDAHELAPEPQHTLAAMAIGALAALIFKDGRPAFVEKTWHAREDGHHRSAAAEGDEKALRCASKH